MPTAPLAAQAVERFSLETTAALDQFGGQNAVTRPQIVFDISANLRLGAGWQIYVRPWFRQPRTNHWDKQIYQMALRYERAGPVATRLDAGFIVSPVGLGLFDSSPGLNPNISPHLSYFTPMLPFGTGGPPVNAIASTYPLGAVLTMSTIRWDARAAVVDSAPTRIRTIGGSATKPRRTPVAEAGAGVTPTAGVRVGVSFARGAYLTREELVLQPTQDRQLTMIGVEGEYAFGYTKINGEVIRDALGTPRGTATAYEWFVQGTHTLTPRWFIAARREHTSSPSLGAADIFASQPDLDAFESTLGFRATPELTLRSSFVARRFYGRHIWDQQAAWSIVWARRWR